MHVIKKIAIKCIDIICFTKYVFPVLSDNNVTKLVYIKFTQIKDESLPD